MSLTFTSDAEPGITRHGTRRFSYSWPNGQPVRDADVLARIAALAIPPAWTQVWICNDPDGHLQATGRDAKGRKQFRYHDAFRQEQEAAKFAELADFGAALPRIRRRVQHDLASSAPTQVRQTALVVRLLDLTAIRVGNEEYARTNGSFGLSTLRSRQARVDGAAVAFTFIGKSGRKHRVELHDRRLAKLVAQCQHLPGQRLFTYLDEHDNPRPLYSHHVNDYLRETVDSPFTAKTFRTWIGTTTAASALAGIRDKPTKGGLLLAYDEAAAVLGNTRTVCRKSYVHPIVEETYLDGTLPDRWRSGPARASATCSVAERRTLHLLTSNP